MSAPNPSTLWGRLIIGELAAQHVDTVVVSPGSRSTPLVVAAAAHSDVETYSILDERAAAYFAVGRGKATNAPTAIVSTSGTAAANFHPAVLEADRSRTPLIVCTADRPPERHGVGANQTMVQGDLYGDAVRYEPALPEPAAAADRQRALCNRVAQAVHRSQRPVPGPVHLNVPFRKPLAPEPSPSETPRNGATRGPPTVTERGGERAPTADDVDRLAAALGEATRPLVVAGPSDRLPGGRLRRWAASAGIPIMADPLSGVRFGGSDGNGSVFGGYDAWLQPARQAAVDLPDLVVRFGARPTSKRLRTFLSQAAATDILVDPAGQYRDPTHAADEVFAAGAGPLLDRLAARVGDVVCDRAWREELQRFETAYWDVVEQERGRLPPEAGVVHTVFDRAPPGAGVFVSNSMPVREADRFGRPRDASLTVFGNRGVSGIDGITSTGLGVASVRDEPTVVVTGDLAFYHDLTGLLTAQRCDVAATFVVINNDGGGIFHMLPIESWDPPFTDHFKTPHGLQFGELAAMYDLPYERVEPATFDAAFEAALETEAATVLEVSVDAATHHRRRDAFQELVSDRLAEAD